MSRTLFISDLHLDPGQPAVIDLFLEFMAGEAREADTLYVLGDLFEAWIGDDDDTPELQPVVDALHALGASGTRLFFMHGNRDFLASDGFARRSGCQLLREPTVIDLYGEPTLLLHGDSLCTDDHEYQAYRAQVRDPAWQEWVLNLDLDTRRGMAREAREHSQVSKEGKSQEIMDVNAEAVEAVMREHGVRRLIHGHTHRPAHHRFELDGRPAERIVLGDWHPDHARILRCDPHGCSLSDIAPSFVKSGQGRGAEQG